MKKKRISGEAYDINKQTIIDIAPKAKTESRAHYAPQPASQCVTHWYMAP